MNAVLDTAILISAALAIQRDTMSSSRRLFERGVCRDGFDIVTSEPMLRELSDVLSRPNFALPVSFAIDFVERIALAAVIVRIQGLAMGCRDARDDKVLETALNANADFLVARDRDLHEPSARCALEKVGLGIRDRPIRVVSVRAFADALDGPRFSPLVFAAAGELHPFT